MIHIQKIAALSVLLGALTVVSARAVTVNYEVDGAGPYTFTPGDVLTLTTFTGSVTPTVNGPAVMGELNAFVFLDSSSAAVGSYNQTITRDMTILVALGTEVISQNSTVTVTHTGSGKTDNDVLILTGSPVVFNLAGGLKLTVTPLDFEGVTVSKANAEIDGKILADFQLTQTAVPEPTTVIAGALLLLPFGFGTLRALRKNKSDVTVV